MTPTDVSAAMASYARSQIGAAYIMGATAEACTPRYRASLAGGRSADYADKIRSCCPVLSGDQSGCTGCRWEGRLAYDCAQLTRHAAEAAGLTLPSGATSQWQEGDWGASGVIGTLPADYVACMYRRHDGRMVHTGVYTGDGTVIEARGHADGVIRSDLGDYPWTHWAILRGMACPEGATVMQAQPVLRKGCSGEDVVTLQEALIAAGYTVGNKGVDGIYGSATRAAVMQLQRAEGLVVDGICGEQTWAALDNLASGVRYDVLVSGVSEAVARRILADYGGTMTEVAP